jgi:ketosteroid isomerase-like protein
MKALTKTVLVLVGCVSVAPVLAQPPKATSAAPSTVDAINQIARDWGNAEIASDVGTLSQFIADDWVSGYPGKASTKESFLTDVKSGAHRLLSFELGPQDVKMFGNIAVVQGSVTERRVGHQGTFHAAYMDVFENRGGEWMVVRSFAKKID